VTCRDDAARNVPSPLPAACKWLQCGQGEGGGGVGRVSTSCLRFCGLLSWHFGSGGPALLADSYEGVKRVVG
jgi:hypothetical protein